MEGGDSQAPCVLIFAPVCRPGRRLSACGMSVCSPASLQLLSCSVVSLPPPHLQISYFACHQIRRPLDDPTGLSRIPATERAIMCLWPTTHPKTEGVKTEENGATGHRPQTVRPKAFPDGSTSRGHVWPANQPSCLSKCKTPLLGLWQARRIGV